MEVTPLQGKAKVAARYSTARINVYEGSVRSGKTIGTLLDWIRFCRQGPAGNLLMTGRTERTIINNLVLPIQEMLGEDRVRINRGNGTVDICGRVVFIIGANNEQARTKIQGLTLAGAYVDEASTLPESYWNMLTSRLSVAGARLWATCNPEGPRHWFKLKWIDRAKLWVDHHGNIIDRTNEYQDLPEGDEKRPMDLHRFSFILDDNAHNLDDEYIKSTKAMYSGLWYLRMILGQWALADGAIYDMFDSNTHVVAELPEITRLIGCGIDYGERDNTRGELLGLGADGCLYVIAEWNPPKGTHAERSRWLAEFFEQHGEPPMKFVDPAALGFRRQLTVDGMSDVFKASNKVQAGIGLVASLLKAKKLFIHSSCTALINEIPGYVWDSKKAEEKGIDEPIKLDDHSVDALRYALMTSRPLWEPYVELQIPELPTSEIEEGVAA